MISDDIFEQFVSVKYVKQQKLNVCWIYIHSTAMRSL